MMIKDLKDIFQQFQNLAIYEKRSVTDSFVEIVLYNKDIQEWNKLLHEFMGEPFKKAADKPSRQMKDLTNEYGGIEIGQTLFKKDLEEGIILAMFWPWGNGNHTTLKIFTLKENPGNQNVNRNFSLIGWFKKFFSQEKNDATKL